MAKKKESIRVMLIDDDPDALDLLSLQLKKHVEVDVVGTISNAGKAVKEILSKRPELLFLDIEMPSKSGFDIVEELAEQGFEPSVIFVTAFDRYTIPAIRHAAFDYLMKPVDKKELENAIHNYVQKKRQTTKSEGAFSIIRTSSSHEKLKFSTRCGFVLIPPDDIFYIEADWNYSKIHWGENHVETVSINLGKIAEALPADTFYRISRAAVINLKYLTRIDRTNKKGFLLKDGKEVCINIPILNIRKLEKYLDSQRQ